MGLGLLGFLGIKRVLSSEFEGLHGVFTPDACFFSWRGGGGVLRV